MLLYNSRTVVQLDHEEPCPRLTSCCFTQPAQQATTYQLSGELCRAETGWATTHASQIALQPQSALTWVDVLLLIVHGVGYQLVHTVRV